MALNSKGILLFDSVTDDNPVIGTSQDPDFPIDWAVNDDTSNFWKAAAFGTADIIIDAGAAVAVNAIGMGVHNLKTAAATLEVLKGSGLTLSDAFDNSSFDTTNFGSAVAASGTVTETTELATVSTGFGDAALVYDKNTLKGRTISYTLQHKFDTTPTAGLNYKMLCLGLWQDSSAPAVQTGVAAADAKLTVMLYGRNVGGAVLFYIAYRTSTGSFKYWTGTAWADTETSFYTGVTGTQYVSYIVNDGTGPDVQLWNAGETVEHGSAQPLWGSIDDTLNPEYAVWGDPSTDGVITAAELKLFAEDAFDDSSIDSGLWGTDIDAGSGAATITETTELVIEITGNVDAGAILYYKKVLSPRAQTPWKIRNTCKTLNINAPVGGMNMLMLYQDSVAPAVAAAGAVQPKILAEIYQTNNGSIVFRYWDTGGADHYWDGAAWQPINSTAVSGVNDTFYIAELYNDQTNLYFRLYNSAGTLIESAQIAWSSVRAESNSTYAVMGDAYDNAWSGKLVTTGFSHSTEGYRGTINSQLYEHTGEGGTYTQVLAPFTPDFDLAFIKQFTSDTARYWKIQIITAAVIPYVGYTRLGQVLTLDRYLQDGYDPQPMNYQYTTGVTEGGNFLPVNVAPPRIPLSLNLANLTDTWLETSLRPAMDGHIGLGRPFLWSWDITNHPKQTFICRLKPGTTWASPYMQSRRTTTLTLEGLFDK